MTNTPINLSRARKQRARDIKKATGDANAVKFGQTKGEKQRAAKIGDKASRHLDGHLRDDPDAS